MTDPLQMPTRAPALYLVIGLMGGLSLARIVDAPIPLTLLTAAGLAGLSYLAAVRDRSVWLLCFITATLLASWNYGTLRLPHKPELAELNRPLREAQLNFEVERILRERTRFDKASGIGRILSANKTSRLERGEFIYFRLNLKDSEDFQLLRGSELAATGVLIPIGKDFAPDSFEDYLKGMGIHYRFERSSDLIETASPSHFDSFCQAINLRFETFLKQGAPEGDARELSQIYTAMLLGKKAQLSPEQKERFRTTGTMHFFAISGLHIGVIATVIAHFLALIRIPRRLSPFIGLPLLFLYVEITGAPPSAVRAFLMALFFWLSFAFSRQRSPLAALAASAVFVLIVSPTQLWSIGFQLSYLVVLSIVLFGLPLNAALTQHFAPFSYLPEASWAPSQRLYASAQNALILLFSISTSAWLASAPLSASFFGFFSPGAIFLNMLLVNLAALAISTGVITIAVSLVGLTEVSAFLNHAAWLTIQLMDTLVTASTQIPWMVIPCEGFPKWIGYSALAAFFALLLWIHQRKTGERRAFLWFLPPAVIGAGLLLGLSYH